MLFFVVVGSAYAQNIEVDKEEVSKKGNKMSSSINKQTPELKAKFKELLAARGSSYKPRTKHLNPDGTAKYTNRLFLESSPYLLQHAHNPVDWYPWGDEAFKKAKELDLPVLLSVGYSTCHWCHVMEEESFEDVEIAEYINKNFIAIKVDREERPDVDAVYMKAVQALTQRGGWPMNVWLTHDKKPFFGGTYFPPRDGDRGAHTGFLTILERIKETFDNERERILEAGKRIVEAISRQDDISSSSKVTFSKVSDELLKFVLPRYDEKFGGFNSAPKFPSSFPVRVIFRKYLDNKDEKVLDKAISTLKKMARGGMYDHVAGGFHRYSTDRLWLVPHFEKMLYDNALLAVVYLEGFLINKDPELKSVVAEILDYVVRDMTSSKGAFYSATDADSITPNGHREEGWFFTWSEDELKEILTPQEFLFAEKYYGITEGGNFEGRNIFYVVSNLKKVASILEISEEQANKIKESIKAKLYRIRSERPLPIRDEKIITAWNGLMISGFAKAGFHFNRKDYIDVASRAANFILKNLYKEKSNLFRSFKGISNAEITSEDLKKYNVAKYDAFLNDYAFFVASLLDLFEVTGDIQWLQKAIEINNILLAKFEDKENGGFYMTSSNQEELLVREKPIYDGAIPSGNSIAMLNLLRLSEITSNDIYRKSYNKALEYFSGSINENPISSSEILTALNFADSNPSEIVLVSKDKTSKSKEQFLDEVRSRFLPNKVLIQTTPSLPSDKELLNLVPLTKNKGLKNGKVTAYVCKNQVCKLPSNSIEEFVKYLF